MNETPDMSIITVNFNGIRHTRELLSSIDQFVQGVSYEVIVVDNGSFADEAVILSTEFRRHKIIRSSVNLGFSGGNNLGIKASCGRYMFLLNNDTLLVDNSICNLVKVLESDSTVGAVSPKIHFQNPINTIQFAGFTEFSKITIRNRTIGYNEFDKGQYDTLSETASTHGAAMMVKRDVIDKIGYMPEIYFLYYEEHDWCSKMRKYGYKLMYQPSALIIHKESQCTGVNSYVKSYYISRNRLLYAFRNRKGWVCYMSIAYQVFIANPKDILKFFFIGRKDLAKAVLSGVFDFFKIKQKLCSLKKP